jgi:acyl carrier protein
LSSVPDSATEQASQPAGNTQLRQVVATHLAISPDQLAPDTEFGRDLCMDSLAAAEMFVVIENSLDVQLLNEVLSDRDALTYGDLEKFVNERLGAVHD